MDYQAAENQAVQLQNQADQVVQGIKGLADKLQTKITDPALGRELVLDLREAALAIQKQNQSTLMLVEQMAQYIHGLETQMNALPQSGFQSRGWAGQPYASGGGGFMGNVMSGLGLGAGFGLASDLVGGLFNAL
ncbi:MAG TPA: hypothetical protein VMU87_06945 [Stellaceae bacterium]|nr:hypothetical protein [Stellaceae bacterium]